MCCFVAPRRANHNSLGSVVRKKATGGEVFVLIPSRLKTDWLRVLKNVCTCKIKCDKYVPGESERGRNQHLREYHLSMFLNVGLWNSEASQKLSSIVKTWFQILVFIKIVPYTGRVIDDVTKTPNGPTIHNLEADQRTVENVGAFLDIRDATSSIRVFKRVSIVWAFVALRSVSKE